MADAGPDRATTRRAWSDWSTVRPWARANASTLARSSGSAPWAAANSSRDIGAGSPVGSGSAWRGRTYTLTHIVLAGSSWSVFCAPATGVRSLPSIATRLLGVAMV